jgi:short-subunit dehydrogenase
MREDARTRKGVLIFMKLLELWLRRRWRPDPAALERWAGMRPAVLVTGGSEGIGLAIARRFAAAGRTIVLVARRPEPLAEAAATIRRAHGADAFHVPLDVTRADAADVIERELTQRGLYVDVLVNSAGIGLAGEFVSQDPHRVAALIDLNVRALALLTRHFMPAMCLRGRGGVLNVASLACYAPGPYQSAYYASKAFVTSLTEAVAWEARGFGVRVAVLAPGPVRTHFHARMGAESAWYRRLMLAAHADSVAWVAVLGFRWGRTVIIPGLVSTFTALAMRLTPHPLLLPIVGWLLKPRGNSRDVRR